MRVLRFIERTLDAQVAPMVYIMMFINIVIGFCFMTGMGVDVGLESILYDTGVLFNKSLWGLILFGMSVASLTGLILKVEPLIQLGALPAFMVWTFAAIALALAGHWYIFVTVALFQLLFHGYVYLSVTTGHLFREAIYRR